MHTLNKSWLVSALILVACASEVESSEEDLAVVQAPLTQRLEARYQKILKRLKTAEWGTYCGADGGDLAAAQSERVSFLLDPQIDRQLTLLARSRDPRLARRARDWVRYRAQLKPTSDPEVLSLRGQIAQLTSDPAVTSAVFSIVAGLDAEDRAASLVLLEQQFRTVEQLAIARAARLDAVAQELGYASYVALRPGLHPQGEVLAECRRQAAASARGWETLRAEVPDASFAHLLGEATRWTDDATTFLSEVSSVDYAREAYATMGFALDEVDDIRTTDRRAARAFGVSIPGEIRFCGATPSGYQGTRDYLHEFSHGLHMKHIRAPHLPARVMPNDTGLAEGVAETFALLAGDHGILRALVPDVTDEALAELDRASSAYEAAAVRYICLHALVESEWQSGVAVTEQRFAEWTEEFFGEAGHTPPVFVLLPYLFLNVESSLYVQDFVWANEFRDAFVDSLEDTPLASLAAGRYLADTVLARGNGLTVASWLDNHPDLD